MDVKRNLSFSRLCLPKKFPFCRIGRCGRWHNSLFLTFLKGREGMGKQMDRLMSLTRYQIIRMKEMDEFHLLSDDPQCVNVCFWYVPKRLRGQDLTEEVKIELGKVRKHFNVLFPTRTIFIRKPLANFPKTLMFR